MSSSAAVVARVSVLVAITGCGAYSGITADPPDAGATPTDTTVRPEPAEPEPAPVEPAPTPDPVAAVPRPPAAVRLARSSALEGYLTDRAGQPLYMYVNDIAGSKTSTCLGACTSKWKAYDGDPLSVDEGIEPTEIARFHRQDGDFQLTYKGFPLYLRVDEKGATDPTVDGTDGRWFVARDYLAFLAPPKNFEPAGAEGSNPEAPFLTDGFGRTLYVCLDDVPESAAKEPHTTCSGDCIAERTPWFARATVRSTALPSALSATDLSAFLRPDGAVQLTYRGWPLYYFAGDLTPGQTAGHNEQAWRAIDPVSFGLDAERETLRLPTSDDAQDD